MPGNVVHCIYCCKMLDLGKGQGDHIIPAALGEFRDDRRFRCICPYCNNLIGRSEQQLLQCAPESLFRDIVKPAAPKGRKRRRSRARQSMGMPGPEFTVNLGDHRELVHPTKGQPKKVEPCDQLVVCDQQGCECFIRLFSGMRVDQLQNQVNSKGIKDLSGARLCCDERKYGEFRRLIQEAYPRVKFEQLPHTEAGIHEARGSIQFTFNEHYFRAIAKIAFHYYLVYGHRNMRGDEPVFEPIRRFIMKGGSKDEFFRSSGRRFVTPFGELVGGGAVLSRRWCHILACDDTSHDVVVYVSLFVGPDRVGNPHYVTLGSLSSNILIPGGTRGHVYLYCDRRQADAGFAGRVEPASLSRFR